MTLCKSAPAVDIVELIENENVVTHFQPVVSVNKKTIAGFEALSRGVHPADGKLLSPLLLLEAAARENALLELDRLFRRKAFENYRTLYRHNPNWFLTVNFDASLLDRGIGGLGNIVRTVEEFQLNPNNIVIEIVESNVKDLVSLKKFVDFYHERGFLIALDDFGAGHSNLDRIAVIKPDVLKADRSMVCRIDREYYKQEILKSLVNLSHKLGALVIAEGVEREEEALTALELGADFLQGFYFCLPNPSFLFLSETLKEPIGGIVNTFKESKVARIRHLHDRRKDYERIVHRLNSVEENRFDEILKISLGDEESIECLYILNPDGIQISETLSDPEKLSNLKRVIFQPASRGTDHSMKDYFILHAAGSRLLITDPYISGASGHMCRTVSLAFLSSDRKSHILCVDVNL